MRKRNAIGEDHEKQNSQRIIAKYGGQHSAIATVRG